ncbi:hypothetical protein MHY30_12370 [Microbacterium sp. ACRRU]|uniref:DUF6611 family protein n=1 Tax=Microbacterium sp. ACRRU TaxID=2918204 RepID=UPI001EF5F503|nr:DUF6611 family protein [Microbacterium sp. ACRRU]MCG7418300.1 hypothetical protein [Microbacterium sp. ACRRU]
MTAFFRSDLLWGYTAAHPRRYRAGTVTVVLFPPDSPALVRRMLFLHRFSGPLFVVLFVITSVVGATVVLVEAAALVALAFAASVNNALHRATSPARARLARVELCADAARILPEERYRLVGEFLATASQRPASADPAHLHRLWRDLYADLRSVNGRERPAGP